MATTKHTKKVQGLERSAKGRTLAKIWQEAAGLLKGRKIDPMESQCALRREWQ